MSIPALAPPLGSPSHLDRLSRLIRPAIATEPVGQAAITWSGPPGAQVQVNGITALAILPGDAASPYTLDLSLSTVAQVATWLSGLPGCAATVLASCGSLSGLALVEGTTLAPDALQVGTALMWALLRAVALLFDVLSADGANAYQTAALRLAVGVWLDYLAHFYGTERLAGESDDQLQARVVRDLLTPYCNGVAMEGLFARASGTTLQITDVPGVAATFAATFAGSLGSLSVGQIVSLLNRYRAAGTNFQVYISVPTLRPQDPAALRVTGATLRATTGVMFGSTLFGTRMPLPQTLLQVY